MDNHYFLGGFDPLSDRLLNPLNNSDNMWQHSIITTGCKNYHTQLMVTNGLDTVIDALANRCW